MRTIIHSKEFDDFFDSLPIQVQDKILYALNIVIEMKIISSKLVKKLIGTKFYELRISMQDEWRIIMFPIDNDSFIECCSVLMLNGFKKKSTKDYRKEIRKAQKILNESDYEN